jgi:ankyrin repeat protein
MSAVENNMLETVNLLLNNGAIIDSSTRSFITSVHNGNTEVVKVLITAGIDVNAPAPILGEFALSRAVEKGNLEMVSILLESGAKIPKNDPVFGNVLKLAKLVNAEIYNLLLTNDKNR